MRRKIIEAILTYSKEEYEKVEDMIELASMSEEELVNNLINILKYYAEE